MRFGNLRHRILFAKPAGTATNGMGETVPAFSLYHPRLPKQEFFTQENQWTLPSGEVIDINNCQYAFCAEVTPLTGRQYEQSQKLRAETTYHIRIRFIPGLASDMYVIFENKKLLIDSVLDADEKYRSIKIVCHEVL